MIHVALLLAITLQPYDRTSYRDRREPSKDEVSRVLAEHGMTPEQGRASARSMTRFFETYPADGAIQLRYFVNWWATFETFDDYPLQAYLYRGTNPLDAGGHVRTARWKAYVEAVETGQRPEVIEEAFLRAHIHDVRDMTRADDFAVLFAASDPWYRSVVESYIDTLEEVERDLDRGANPVHVSRMLFAKGSRALVRRGHLALGWISTREGFRNLLRPANRETRRAIAAMGMLALNLVFGVSVRRPEPTKVHVDLSQEEAYELTRTTGYLFRTGRHLLTADMLRAQGATIAEPDRNADDRPPRRYPLRFSDLIASRPLRPGQRMAGKDGVLQADEIRAVIRNVQARARSQLIDEFHKAYPVAQGGLLAFSANTLALAGAYAESEMFAAIANGVMPVDNEGRPKNVLWRDYVSAYERHRQEGAPSRQRLEELWMRAHMSDFQIVDTPAFQKLLRDFRRRAAGDPSLHAMAVYAEAMIGGRQVFESEASSSRERALAAAFLHVLRTLAASRTIPLLREDLTWLLRYVTDAKLRAEPESESGLATDRTMLMRSLHGGREALKLVGAVQDGVVQKLALLDTGRRATRMLDLQQLLSPDLLAQVDRRVVEFYHRPGDFDVTVGIELDERTIQLSVGETLGGQFDIADRVRGFEGYPVETELLRDDLGRVRWVRNAVVDGERRTLFDSYVEVEGRQLVETFSVAGQSVALRFNVEVLPSGGVRFALDKTSLPLAQRGIDIEFVTVPDGQGLRTTGRFKGGAGRFPNGEVTFRIR